MAFSDIAPTIIKESSPNIPYNTKIGQLLSLNTGGVNIINLIFFFIGFIFLTNILVAAYEFISSNGDPKKIQGATTRLLNGFVGIAIAIASFLIIRLITSLINLPADII